MTVTGYLYIWIYNISLLTVSTNQWTILTEEEEVKERETFIPAVRGAPWYVDIFLFIFHQTYANTSSSVGKIGIQDSKEEQSQQVDGAGPAKDSR